MKAAVILAMLPLGIATALMPRWPDPRPAVAETFVQRFEAVYPKHTFEERWWPGEGLPDAQGSPPVDLLAPKVVRTTRIAKDAVGLPQEAPQEALPATSQATSQGNPGQVATAEAPIPEPRPAVRVKPRPIRVADICARHGMHRVDYGKRWRCRK